MDASIFPRGQVTVVGVLNLTPDSFSDGGRFAHAEGSRRSDSIDVDAAVRAGRELLAGGARILDVGGESTRPGAQAVPEPDEIARVVPVIRRLVAELGEGASRQEDAVARQEDPVASKRVNMVSG